MSCFYFSILSGQNHDTIVFSINKAQYEKVAKEELRSVLANSRSNIYGKYAEDKLRLFSIPVFEWNQKAKEFTCASREKLENLLSFVENPYFQMISFIDSQSNIVGGVNLATSQIRTERRIRDSTDWVSQIPNVPFSPFIGNPFPHYDLKELKNIYKFHLKHPDVLIFRIADYEGFWVMKDYNLYKLEGISLKNANQYLYKCGEQYIRDIANGIFSTGYQYMGCFCRKELTKYKFYQE